MLMRVCKREYIHVYQVHGVVFQEIKLGCNIYLFNCEAIDIEG